MPLRLGLEKLIVEWWCAPELRFMMRELKAGMVEARRAGRRRCVRRKGPRWLTAHCVSKPSGVVDSGVLRTPVLHEGGEG